MPMGWPETDVSVLLLHLLPYRTSSVHSRALQQKQTPPTFNLPHEWNSAVSVGHKVPGELVDTYESRLPFLVAEASRRPSSDDDRIGWPASIPSVWQSRLRTLRAFE